MLANFRGISSLRFAPVRYSTFRKQPSILVAGQGTQRTGDEASLASLPKTPNEGLQNLAAR
nr:MAG TPA: hypothetical protein [Inoviridae sp.]